jgi:ABC-2 type transport system permease protein
VTTIEKPTIDEIPAARKKAGLPLRPHVLGAIFRRDFLGYFSNPAGYVFITLFVLASSWVAFGLPEFFANNLANLDTLNRWMPYLLLFFIPAITMSVWAEERRQGTEELLLTLPARDVEVVLGKYLAAVGIYTVALAFSLSHVVVLRFLGHPDPGVMFATYLGYWLMGAMLIAFGMVASIVSSNVTVAFILGGLFCALPVFADLFGSFLSGLPGLSGAGRALESLSVPAQFRDFSAGVITLSGVVYFVALAAAMLYVNMVLLGRRHWAGGPESGRRWAHYLARVVALVVGLGSLAVLAGHYGARADVSAEGLSTLSAESRALIRQIPESRPVFIQAYYSPEVPREYVETKADLLNLLREIKAVGGERVQLNLIPTERYSEAATKAEKQFGITPKRVFTTDEARQSSQEIFLGAAFTSGPEEVVVPFLDRGLPVEYELVRSLRVVAGSKRKKVGILQTDAKLLGGFDFRAMGQDEEWEVVTELKKQYEVSSVSGDTPIPSDLDALVVAQPSSLTQPQIDNLTAYVRAGGPTLLFVDPLPFVDPSIAPLEPRMPPTGMFGGAPPPEPKGELTPLLDLLGVAWPPETIVWNSHNPHPVLADAPFEYLFIDQGSLADDAFGKDPASSGLQEVVLLFAGALRSKGGGLEFTPLLRTDDSGGTLTFAETIQRGFMGMQLNRRRPYFPTGQAYTLAARVKGKVAPPPPDPAKKDAPPPATKEAHVVLVADLDLISNTFFQLRRDRPESYEFLNFDNVSFVLNCVDTLIGDDSFIALRKRRPRHRTLEAVEEATHTYVEASQNEAKKAEDQAKAELAQAQERLDKKVAEVRDRKDIDERTKEIMLASLQDVEERRLEVTKATIEAKKERSKEESRAVREQRVRGIHSRIKALAILLPPLPALVLAGFVFASRAGRENRGANPNRIA